MKKYISLFLLLTLCLGLLCACGGEYKSSGDITEVNMDEQAGLLSFVIREEADRYFGVLLTDETSIVSWVEGITAEEFKQFAPVNTSVSVVCDHSKGYLTTKEGGRVAAYSAKLIEITGVRVQDNLTLADGTSIETFRIAWGTSYKLSDGNELLSIGDVAGPANAYRDGTDGYNDLGDEAQAAITSYYESQEAGVDLQLELENAYAAYLSRAKGKPFNAHFIAQDITPASSSEQMIYFMKSVTRPLDGEVVQDIHIGSAFKRSTGEAVSNSDLFSCTEDELAQAVIDLSGVKDEMLRAEMLAAFNPDHIVLFAACMEVSFPAGSLPSQAHSYVLGIDYDERLLEILNDWAVPEKML